MLAAILPKLVGVRSVVIRVYGNDREAGPALQELLRAVDVGEKGFERAHALGNPGLEVAPLGAFDDARHSIQRERPLFAGEVERDTLREVARRERLGRRTGQLQCIRNLLMRLLPLEFKTQYVFDLAHIDPCCGHAVSRRKPGRLPTSSG